MNLGYSVISTQDSIESCKKFYKKIYENYKINNTVSKEELLSKLPKYLNKPNTTKAEMIKKWKTDVTKKEFENLINTQTVGADYPSFYYYMLKYDLKLDDNNMIIFTDEFPFDKKIKKEALFIWNILYNLKTHPLLGKFYEKITHGLQFKHETSFVDGKRKFEYDLVFTNLNISIEIDENHIAKKTLDNDKVKTIVSEMNGYVLHRLNFQKIYYGNGKGKGEIKDGRNANTYMLNSEYYKNFLEDLYNSVCYSLLRKEYDFRKNYIMYLLNLYMEQRIETIQIDITNIKSSNKSLLNKKNKILSNYKKNLSLINDKSGKFIELFELKNNSYNDKENTKSNDIKNIKLEKVISLLGI